MKFIIQFALNILALKYFKNSKKSLEGFLNKSLVFTELIGVYHFLGVLFGFSGTFSCWMFDGGLMIFPYLMPLKKNTSGIGSSSGHLN